MKKWIYLVRWINGLPEVSAKKRVENSYKCKRNKHEYDSYVKARQYVLDNLTKRLHRLHRIRWKEYSKSTRSLRVR